MREQQLQYELESDAVASQERLAELVNRAHEGDLNAPRATAFMRRAFALVRDNLAAELSKTDRGVLARHKSWLRRLPIEVATLLALRVSIELGTRGRVGKGETPAMFCQTLGRLLETEVRIREAEAVNPLYMKKVVNRMELARTTSTRHIRAAVNAAYDAVMKGELDTHLSNVDAVKVGKIAIQAVIDAGILETQRIPLARGGGHHKVALSLSEEVFAFLVSYGDKDTAWLVNPKASTMMCEPDPWVNLNSGGYLSTRRKQAAPLYPLTKVPPKFRGFIRKHFTAEAMPDVFECANYLQATAYTYHKATVAAIQRVWESGGGVLGVPTKKPPQRPEFEFPEDFNPREAEAESPEEFARFQDWKRQAAAYYTNRRTWRGHTQELGGFLRALADNKDTSWFPVYVDFRGRWYYRGRPNPQGSDMAKAVLHFREAKPLGTEGVFWLKVQIANSFGYDKVRLAKRAEWVDENWEAIERALDAPEDYQDVWGTDSPWCMFAAAWELREAYRSRSPSTYRTGLVVHQDASCSGLQHFSALLRDPVGAQYVNLVDTGEETKADIYAEVARRALEAMQDDLQHDDEVIRGYALYWQANGISRALAKKPVMTYTYGATLQGTAEWIHETLSAAGESPQYAACLYAARKLFDGVEGAVPAAAALMKWLRNVAAKSPDGLPIMWDSPSGFKVMHDYRTFDEVRVRLRSCGVQYCTVYEMNDGTNKQRMQNALPPNFVHSLDAAHMTAVALEAKAQGLSLSAIHDSFGTHPCDVSTMRDIVRNTFVDMYTPDVLGKFLADTNIDAVTPEQGEFNIELVKESEFFVS